MADSEFTYENLWIHKKVNNSEEMVGCILEEYVKGTFNSAGVATVNTRLKSVLAHSITYNNNSATNTYAISSTLTVTPGSDGAPNTVEVKGVASVAFSGFLYGRAVLN